MVRVIFTTMMLRINFGLEQKRKLRTKAIHQHHQTIIPLLYLHLLTIKH